MISLLDKAGIGRGEAARILDSALKGADDGELFVEQRLSEQAVFDDGRLKSASFDEAQGFLIGRPMSAARARAMLVAEKR